MILYVNGCSHSAAAEAAVQHAWACDDGDLWMCGKEPHPANLAVSYGRHVADALNAELVCEAQSGGCNDRTMRVTRDWIANNAAALSDTFVILQWTTWEREEWFYQNEWWQVNASGIDIVPPELEDRYKQYVISVDWNQKTRYAHNQIWSMHQWLQQIGVRHLFFSAHSTFSDIDPRDQKNWDRCYIEPYSRDHSYNALLKHNGFDYVSPQGYHFGADGHRFWANYVLQYINDNNLLDPHEISLD
jgi:hypothetical protein